MHSIHIHDVNPLNESMHSTLHRQVYGGGLDYSPRRDAAVQQSVAQLYATVGENLLCRKLKSYLIEFQMTTDMCIVAVCFGALDTFQGNGYVPPYLFLPLFSISVCISLFCLSAQVCLCVIEELRATIAPIVGENALDNAVGNGNSGGAGSGGHGTGLLANSFAIKKTDKNVDTKPVILQRKSNLFLIHLDILDTFLANFFDLRCVALNTTIIVIIIIIIATITN